MNLKGPHLKQKKSKAFSLIELLVVVTIIAVLIGQVQPYVIEYLEQAKISKALNDLDEFSRAINAFEITTGITFNDSNPNKLRGSYLQNVPVDPWGNAYSFASAPESAGAFLSSSGPDQLLGTGDDIQASFKGKLAIAGIYWADINNDGAITPGTIPNKASDVLYIRFNRAASFTSTLNPGAQYLSNSGNWFLSGANNFDTLFNTGIATPAMAADGKLLTYFFATSPVAPGLLLGSDVISMTTNVVDPAGSPPTIASVTILAQ